MQPQKLPEFKRFTWVKWCPESFSRWRICAKSQGSRVFLGRGKNPTFNFRESLQWVYKSLRNQVHDHLEIQWEFRPHGGSNHPGLRSWHPTQRAIVPQGLQREQGFSNKTKQLLVIFFCFRPALLEVWPAGNCLKILLGYDFLGKKEGRTQKHEIYIIVEFSTSFTWYKWLASSLLL